MVSGAAHVMRGHLQPRYTPARTPDSRFDALAHPTVQGGGSFAVHDRALRQADSVNLSDAHWRGHTATGNLRCDGGNYFACQPANPA